MRDMLKEDDFSLKLGNPCGITVLIHQPTVREWLAFPRRPHPFDARDAEYGVPAMTKRGHDFLATLGRNVGGRRRQHNDQQQHRHQVGPDTSSQNGDE